jgi:SAM-dependent methyltransferase
MDHHDHVNLLRPAGLPRGGTWADFGAGSGAFTLALRELIGPEAVIYAVDKDRGSLRELEREYRPRFGDPADLHVLAADFSRPLDLPPLDGALMANSLHFFKDAPTAKTPKRQEQQKESSLAPLASQRLDKLEILQGIRAYLKPGGALLVVEYNADSGNLWVPYPFSFATWRGLAQRAGFSEPRLLATHPSHFLREFYSAVCYREP